MAENKGELHRDAACARPRRRTLSPPRPARLRARRRSPTHGLVYLAGTGDRAKRLVPSIFECA